MFATLRSTIVEHGSSFEPAAFVDADARIALDDLTVIVRVAESMRNRMMKQIADSNAWAGTGALDAARYCATACGLGSTEVRNTIDAEDKLEQLPKTASAVREGRVSSQAGRLIANVATKNPDAEGHLLETAAEGLPRLQAACVKARAEVEDPDERAREQEKARSHRELPDELGMTAGKYRIRPEDGGAFREVLRQETNRLFLEHAKAGDHEPLDAYAADALVNLVLGRAGRDVDKTAAPAPRYNVHVFADYGILTNRYSPDVPLCEIPGVGPVNVEWVRSIMGDALIDFVIANGKDVKTLTTPARRFTKAMQTVFLIQDGECGIVDCNTRGYLEMDHRHEVRDGGPTCTTNGKRICGPHHDLKSAGWILGPEDPLTGKCTLRPPPGWDP